MWDWKERKVIQKIDLGEGGKIPLELRFLHNPDQNQGYVGVSLSSNVFRFFKEVIQIGNLIYIQYLCTVWFRTDVGKPRT